MTGSPHTHDCRHYFDIVMTYLSDNHADRHLIYHDCVGIPIHPIGQACRPVASLSEGVCSTQWPGTSRPLRINSYPNSEGICVPCWLLIELLDGLLRLQVARRLKEQTRRYPGIIFRQCHYRNLWLLVSQLPEDPHDAHNCFPSPSASSMYHKTCFHG